jgi:hypothetical protein
VLRYKLRRRGVLRPGSLALLALGLFDVASAGRVLTTCSVGELVGSLDLVGDFGLGLSSRWDALGATNLMMGFPKVGAIETNSAASTEMVASLICAVLMESSLKVRRSRLT